MLDWVKLMPCLTPSRLRKRTQIVERGAPELDRLEINLKTNYTKFCISRQLLSTAGTGAIKPLKRKENALALTPHVQDWIGSTGEGCKV
jgi:hypothetical protein